MKKLFIIIAIFLVSYMLNAQTIIEGNNQFAFDLLKTLGDRNQNTFFSPYSISIALFMTAAGARGETEKQMLKVLHQSQNTLAYHKKFKETIDKITNKQSVELSVANSIWPSTRLKLTPNYLNLLNSAYKTQVTQCDYVKNADAEALKINKWVEDKTKNKIKNIIKPRVLDSSTELVLANAIYFLGDWQTSFDSTKNTSEPFFLNSGKQINTTFMNTSYSIGYAEDDQFKVVSIPYKSDEVSMFVFLPLNKDSFDYALKNFDIRRYSSLTRAMQSTKVNLSLPKFKVETEYQLHEKLPAMGMPVAFSGNADFSGMTGEKGLAISLVIHKAFVDVSEKGTEAAAATVVIMSRNGGSHKPVDFKADHPFIFMIKDHTTGQILFMGILNDPKG
jgi:serpin B